VPDYPASAVIAELMGVDRQAEKGAERLCIAL